MGVVVNRMPTAEFGRFVMVYVDLPTMEALP